MCVVVFLLSANSFASDNALEPENTPVEGKSAAIHAETKLQETTSENSTVDNVGIIKDIFHIIFFVSMIAVAVLSYKQAKKTVFSPIKTEIFKYQLKAFESVIGHFQNKGEIDLKKDMDIDNIISINSFELFNSYVKTFMKEDVEINKDFADEQMKMAKGAVVSKEFAEEFFEMVGPDVPVIEKEEEPNDPALKLARWNDKKYGLVHYTELYMKATDEIKSFQNSPLLPSGLKSLLSDYSDLMHESLTAVGEAIEDAGKEMPKNFPNKDTLNNFSPGWISNIHNDKTPKLEPKAIEILGFVNSYLGIDKLAEENV
tara:strand:- start:263 stop:1207 length:945 start_codon:yes stop_codon:yes gene_type:complete